jgi:pimeloyl-ACP methyl ester carboxylesterase
MRVIGVHLNSLVTFPSGDPADMAELTDGERERLARLQAFREDGMGYIGFSDKPGRPGWGVERIAAAWSVLMGRLGYARYGAQGSDWGTSVSASIGQLDPRHVAGIHLTPPLAPPDPATFDELTERERAALASLEHSREWDSGYSQEHATRPQTIGYALVDSPTALSAWIIEKFWAWTDCDGHPRTCSPGTSSWTISCSTGSPAPAPPRRASTATRAGGPRAREVPASSFETLGGRPWRQ